MDYKLFFSTFIAIFLAELGDKTQISVLLISAQENKTLTVLCASIMALALAATLGVLAGKVLATWLNPFLIKTLSGTVFIILGAWIIYRAQQG